MDSESVYGDNDKCIKTKMKKYAGSRIRNFHNNKTPTEKASCKSLLIIMIDSVVKVLSSSIFGRMQIWTKKDINGKPYWCCFRKTFVWWVW